MPLPFARFQQRSQEVRQWRPRRWPPALLAQLRARHQALAARITRRVCALGEDCYPIGARGAPLERSA